MQYRVALSGLLSAFAIVAASTTADAQSMGERLKKRAEEAAKRKIEQRVEQKAGQATDAALDAAENTVKCAASDKACADKAKAEGKKVVTTDAAPGTATTPSAAASPAPSGESGASGGSVNALNPGEGAWANYDFKPGAKILYYDDFMKDEVGDFPKRMEFKEGALEIVEWQGSRYLRSTADSKFYVVLPEALPERFTMEFDYSIPSNGEVWISLGDVNKRMQFGGLGSTKIYNQDTKIMANAESVDRSVDKLRRGRVLADGKYIKVYLDDKRMLNVPNADLGRSNRILFNTDATAEKPALFGNFRIAAGGKKLYDAIAESGRVATQGIYFDTGSDRIRPESSPTLKEIGQMMKEHSDLKLTIEGHTDNVGAVATNQALSEKRAEAVRQTLIQAYGVEEARIAAKGLGASKPVGPNDTPEGRQNNRRVELVKM